MCTATLARAVSTSITVSRDWKPSYGKAFLWQLIMSLIYDLEEFRQHTRDVAFLTYDVIFLKVNYGLALYTVNKLQVNINILVPTDPLFTVELVRQVEQYISGIYADHTINLIPLRTHVPELSIADFVKRRRFIPSRIYISKLSVVNHDKQILRCCGNDTIALHHIECKRDVAKYRPLSTMHPNDDIDTIYWHKFPCGALFAFTNPLADMIEPLPYPPAFSKCKGIQISQHMENDLALFVHSLAPCNLTETLNIVSQKWIPPNIRNWSVCSGISSFGITDELVVAVGENIDDVSVMGQFAKELIHTYKIIRMTSNLSDTCMCDMLVTMMRQLDDNPVWRKWICESTLLWTCVLRIPCSLLATMLKRPDMELLRVLCIRLLHHRIGKWTSEERERVNILCQVMNEHSLTPPRKCLTETNAVRQAFDELHMNAHEMADILVDNVNTVPLVGTIKNNTKKSKKKSSSGVSTPSKLQAQAQLMGPEGLSETVPIKIPPCKCKGVHEEWNLRGTLSTTHKSIVRKMSQEFPSLQFNLIGSGVFSDKGDIDVVVTVCASTTSTNSTTPKLSLPEAYEHVRSITGWIPNYEKVDGLHVGVLCGTFEGVAVDAQVWRGQECVETHSEMLTREAIEFTRKLSAEASDGAVKAIKWMHAWCDVAGLKGHKLCRLPGIGVTCAAIALTCGSPEWNTQSLLTRMRECLSQEMPLINFDALNVSIESVATRCTVPLAILVNERNCCNRMTAATTRHMLDVLAYSLARGVHLDMGNRNVYSEWRKQNMVLCTRMRPRAKASISYSLLSIAASLERHPMIDTLYFADDNDNNNNNNDSDETYDNNAKGNAYIGSVQCKSITTTSADNSNNKKQSCCNHAPIQKQSAVSKSRSEDHCPTCITIMCTLRADADAEIYGFRREDHIRHIRTSTVVVERNGRMFTLALSPRQSTKCCIRSATRICDMISVDGMPENTSFPNALSLTCDVSALFDPNLWESCLPAL